MGVQDYAFMHKNMRVHLVDTPGFDDTNRKDADILKDIAGWLSHTYKKDLKLSGIIYLHRITDTRMMGSARRNLLMFMQLCGSDCYPHVVLVTTMWSQVVKEVGEARERELIQTPEFWGHMNRKGSAVRRHKGDQASALAIIDVLIKNRKRLTLQIQREIVDDGRTLNDTEAGKQLDQDIQRERKKHEKEMREMEKRMQEAIRENDMLAKEHIEEMKMELQQKIEEGEKARESIRADYVKLQNEREAELQRIKDSVNEQTEQLRQRSMECERLKGALQSGQGNTGQLERFLITYERKIGELEKELKETRNLAERKKSGKSMATTPVTCLVC